MEASLHYATVVTRKSCAWKCFVNVKLQDEWEYYVTWIVFLLWKIVSGKWKYFESRDKSIRIKGGEKPLPNIFVIAFSSSEN